MKVLLINSVCGIGSTGKICGAIAQAYEQQGHTAKIAYGRDPFVPEPFKKYAVRIGNSLDVKLHALRTRLLDDHGFGSKSATKKFLKWAEEYDPDILWLHNIHGYYIHIGLLFDWIKSRPQMQVKWTLHDCWAFTGHCSHFSFVQCNNWRSGCNQCSQKKEYPASVLVDRSRKNFDDKKLLFTGVKNMTIITPSQWLADLVKKSFLKEYPVEVQYNEIDRETFKPTLSNFRQKYGLTDKKIILGVANVWTERKGLFDFYVLSEKLPDEYKIILVGLTEQQINALPPEILGLPHTNSGGELAKIYSAADVFVNPSREETFGLTTLEALACGTPAIVYKNTAGEEVIVRYGGSAVDFGVDNLYSEILLLLKE